MICFVFCLIRLGFCSFRLHPLDEYSIFLSYVHSCFCHHNRSIIARLVMQDNVAGLMRLARKGAFFSETDGHGWTPLHWACSKGSAVMAHTILHELRVPQHAGEVFNTTYPVQPYPCLVECTQLQ